MCAAVECGALGRCYGTPLALRKMVRVLPCYYIVLPFHYAVFVSLLASQTKRPRAEGG